MQEKASDLNMALENVSTENAKLSGLLMSLRLKLADLKQYMGDIVKDVSNMVEQLSEEAERSCRFAMQTLRAARHTENRDLLAAAGAAEAAIRSTRELVVNLKAYMLWVAKDTRIKGI